MSDAQSLVERLRAEAQRLSGSSLDNGCAGCGIAANVADEAATLIERLTAPVEGMETTRVADYLRKIADASRRDDGSDIPLGEQCRAGAELIDRLIAAHNELDAAGERVAAEGRQAQGAYELTLAERNWWKARAAAETVRADEAERQRDSFVESSGKMAVRAEGLEDRLNRAERDLGVYIGNYANAERQRVEARDELARLQAVLRDNMSTAIGDVLAERRRQIEVEGFTPGHDDGHTRGELARGAACYCAIAGNDDENRQARITTGWMPSTWPWDWALWKPKDRRRDLVRAGALIVAEIERLDRSAKMVWAYKEATKQR